MERWHLLDNLGTTCQHGGYGSCMRRAHICRVWQAPNMPAPAFEYLCPRHEWELRRGASHRTALVGTRT